MEDQKEQIIILQDFIKLLRFLENNEAKLTTTGNFNLKTLAYIEAIIGLPEHFKEYPIKSEYEWQYLEYLDVLSQLMKLTATRKHYRRLTKSGKEYLAKLPQEQFLLLFEAYWHKLNWAFLFPYSESDKDNPACHLWFSQEFVLKVMLEKRKPDGWIHFQEFAECLRVNMNLKKLNYLGQDLPERVHDCVEQVIIKQLEKFNLIEAKYKLERRYDHDFRKLDFFRMTELGERIILAILFPVKPPGEPSKQMLN